MSGVRPALLGGVALVVVGVLLLLRNLGLLPDGIPVAPLVLIGVGLVILMAGRRSTPLAQEAASVTTDGATSARLVLNHGAGTLRVTAGAASGTVFEGRFTAGAVHHVTRREGRLDVTVQPPQDGRWLSRVDQLRWDVLLPADLPIDLEVRTGASRVTLDLADTSVRSLSVKTGASDVELTVPRRGQTTTAVSAGAADIHIHVPDGLAAAVRTRTALAGLSIDQGRFPQRDGEYRSPDYDTAPDRAEIALEGGVASFAVR